MEESEVPPSASSPFLSAHNGAIEDFRRTAMRPLRDALSDESYAGLLGTTTDSETIFAGLLNRLRDGAGDLAEALTATIRHVGGVCWRLGVRATLNLTVTDGRAMAFAHYSTQGPGNSLYFIESGEAFPGAIVVASERLDGDPGWQTVPSRHLLCVDSESGAVLRPLGGRPPTPRARSRGYNPERSGIFCAFTER